MAEGFEPSEGYPSHAFEACSLGRSDTPPPTTIPDHRRIDKSPVETGKRSFGGPLHDTADEVDCFAHAVQRHQAIEYHFDRLGWILVAVRDRLDGL